jgi:hypothetical protein
MCLALTVLISQAGVAAAIPPCGFDPRDPVEFAPFTFAEFADVILVLRPSTDHPVFAPVERVILGDVERIVKGTMPRTIIYTANTLNAGLQAGVPVKLFLKAFPDRDAHYIIGIFPAEFPPRISVTISATDGTAPVRVTPRGSAVVIEAIVSVEPSIVQFVKLDVYAGFIRPDGTTMWMSGTPLAARLVADADPIPFATGVSATRFAFGLTHRFGAFDPTGVYSVFAFAVRGGTNPRDWCQWEDATVFPVLVTSP